MDVRQLLLQTGLFSQLTPDKLDQLAASLETITIKAGEAVIHKGDTADVLYIIQDGVCEVFLIGPDGQEIILAKMETGAYFGEQALLNEVPGKRNANVRAITDMTLLKISHETFQTVLTYDNKLKKNLKENRQ